MGYRVAALAAALAVMASPPVASAQDAADDGVRRLLGRLEESVRRSSVAQFEALLTASADRVRAASFVHSEMNPGITRVAIHERARTELDSTLPGHGFRVAVDVIQEYGARARIATWALDVKRLGGEGTEREWLIADQVSVGSVEDLYRLSLDSTKQFTATNLEIRDEDLALTLRKGSVFVSDIEHGTTAILFVGSGDMRFRPSPERERTQVRIFSGADALETRFDSAYLRINPGDFAGLLSGRQLVAVPVDREEFRKAERVFRDQAPKSYTLGLGDLSPDDWSLVPDPGDLVAEIHTRDFDTLTYSRSSVLREDISLLDRRRRKTIALYSSAMRDQGRPAPDAALDAAFDVQHYDLDVSVTPDRQRIEGRARLRIRVGRNAVSSLSLRLADPLDVESIVSDEYGRLFSLRVRDQDTVVVSLPATLRSGSDLTLTVAYSGRLDPQAVDEEAVAQLDRPQFDAVDPLDQPEPSLLFSSQVNWYPRPAASHYATATLRITLPAGLDCVASGTADADSPVPVPATGSEPARTLFTFHARQPLRYFAFVVSRLEQAQQVAIRFAPGDAEPGASSDDTRHRSLDLSVTANPGHRARARSVAERAGVIARFYHSLVNDSPYPSLTLALIENAVPGGHSPGYFAVLNEPTLPAGFHRWRNDPASFSRFPDFILAHEIAHQWWGQAVGWHSYQEQWLSEGFAQYFAALYAAQPESENPGGQALFDDLMRHMARWAADETDQGPISLGSRLGHLQDDSRIFRALVYNKSAVVLHMLRQLVGDDVFFRGLRRFYGASRFRSVGTADFRAAMESEAHRPLGRFFERWIYGSTLPRLAFSYRVDSGDVVLQIEQVGDEIFDLPVAVTLQYADGTSTDVLVPVTDRIVSQTIPLAGPLRRAAISSERPPLAHVVRP
jgi:hypothetical protein